MSAIEANESRAFALQARDLGKAYRVYGGSLGRLREALSLGGSKGHELQWALQGVNLDLRRGEALGLVGANGAGKSTLLKVLAGTSAPTTGRYRVNGRVTSLLELGTGFHQDFSGRENVMMHGVLNGHSRREVRRRTDAILDFAELGEAAEAPVRTYSTGMGMRLGFAAALGFDPEVLILDEVFAVGDMYFQKKCVDRLLEFKEGGKTILFCSHSLYDLRQLCEQALWLEAGEVRGSGSSIEVTNRYAAWQREHIDGLKSGGKKHAKGEDWPRIDGAQLLRADGRDAFEVQTGEDLTLTIDWSNPRHDQGAIQVGVAFLRQDKTLCAAAGTHLDGVVLSGPKGQLELQLPKLGLLSGSFTVQLYLFDEAGVFRYEERALDQPLVVQTDSREVGLMRLEHRWNVIEDEREAAA